MTEPKRRHVLSSLAGNLAVFVLLPLALNGAIFGLGWNRTAAPMAGLPPGWVVGVLWLLLFAGMAVARWLLLRDSISRSQSMAAEWVSLLAFLCLLYPLYTGGFSNEWSGLIGNLVTLVVAVPVTVSAFRRSRGAGAPLTGLCVWLMYAAGVTAHAVWR